MWIEELPNGKFKAVERYDDYLTGKSKKVSVTIEKNTAKTRKTAQAALNEKIKKRLAATPKKHELTLEELIHEYREDQKKTVKLSTYKRNYHACNTFMSIFGKQTLVNRLSAKFIRSSLMATGKEPGTLNEHMVRFKALLRWGYKNDLINDISYLSKIEPFKDKTHREKIENKYLESCEVKDLLEKMKISKWKELTEFLVLSGLRPGEAIALELSDVDLKARLITVNKTYDSNNHVITSAKTLCSIREVYIQDELFVLCKKIKHHALSERLTTGCNQFFQDKGSPLHYYAYRSYLKENALALTGKIITPHALRHTHASLLMEQGIDIDTISRRLGHENSKITKEIYLHVTEKLKEKDNKKIAAIKIL